MKFRYTLLCLLGVLAIFVAFQATPVFATDQSDISVDVAPSNPAPYGNTTITLSSFSVNLNTVTITWIVDGKNSLSGIGKKSFSLTAKAASVETNVTAKIMLPDGEVDKNIVIRPANMVLLWQADDSYVPPFYKGKALPVADSEIKVVAMPEARVGGKTVPPENMTYSWEKDYNSDQSGSGYGKNSYIFTNDYLDNTNNIDVTASTLDQNYSSESSVTIGQTNPEIVFYKQDDAFGTLWEQALSDVSQIQNEETIFAAPYYIAPKDFRNPELIFHWTVDDKTIPVPAYTKNLMPLKAQAGVSGTSTVGLEIENTDKIFQTAKKEINIAY